jgi:hypothetical protein
VERGVQEVVLILLPHLARVRYSEEIQVLIARLGKAVAGLASGGVDVATPQLIAIEKVARSQSTIAMRFGYLSTSPSS